MWRSNFRSRPTRSIAAMASPSRVEALSTTARRRQAIDAPSTRRRRGVVPEPRSTQVRRSVQTGPRRREPVPQGRQRRLRHRVEQSTEHEARHGYEGQDQLVDQRPSSYQDCVAWARLEFQQCFHDSIAQLLHNFPADQVTASGAVLVRRQAGPDTAPVRCQRRDAPRVHPRGRRPASL